MEEERTQEKKKNVRHNGWNFSEYDENYNSHIQEFQWTPTAKKKTKKKIYRVNTEPKDSEQTFLKYQKILLIKI